MSTVAPVPVIAVTLALIYGQGAFNTKASVAFVVPDNVCVPAKIQPPVSPVQLTSTVTVAVKAPVPVNTDCITPVSPNTLADAELMVKVAPVTVPITALKSLSILFKAIFFVLILRYSR